MKFGIVIYDGVEPIDLATYGVLSMAKRIRPQIEICTITASENLCVSLANGLRVLADHDLTSAPPVDVLIITGGPGWIAQAQNEATCRFLRARAEDMLMVSVCTGAMILAAAGLLDGRAATTKCQVVPPEVSPIVRLRKDYPAVDTREASLVDTGGVITGGGVTLGIDTMLYLLGKFFGQDVAKETARIMEYHRAWAANVERFPPLRVASQ
jgi:transcriptional regulator GlxA family with amidase domain